MAKLLEIREQIKSVYSRLEWILIPVGKLILAGIVLMVLNNRMGYMIRIDNGMIVLLAALMCAFLPTGAILLFATLFAMLHLYALSLEVAVLGLVVFLLIYLLYLRFAPGESLVVVGTALLCAWKMPYMVPIVMGLVGSAASAVSVACGVLAFGFLDIVTDNATNISTMADEETLVKLRMVVDALLANRQMMALALIFAATTIVVYLIRRLSIEHAWTIAIVAGLIFDMVMLLVADLFYDLELSFLNIFLVSLLSFVVAMVLQFFRFCVDYGRTERVQFEDDEYYYYVKAIPKMMMPQSSRTVKRINQTRHGAMVTGRVGRRGSAEEETGTEEDYEEFHQEFARRSSGRSASVLDDDGGFGFESFEDVRPAGSRYRSASGSGRTRYAGMDDDYTSRPGGRDADDAGDGDGAGDYEELF
jgi:hypothetical protein